MHVGGCVCVFHCTNACVWSDNSQWMKNNHIRDESQAALTPTDNDKAENENIYKSNLAATALDTFWYLDYIIKMTQCLLHCVLHA